MNKQTTGLFFFLSFILSNVEVPEFINVSIFVRSNHSEPVTNIVLLQILLSQVLEVPEISSDVKNTKNPLQNTAS